MGNTSRTATIKTLEQRHQTLAEQVARLERRAFLTPQEQVEVAELKKRKLATKDRLFEMRKA
ncbi:MAG TPA: YdcH family protein [Polyangiaceae bacterium]